MVTNTLQSPATRIREVYFLLRGIPNTGLQGHFLRVSLSDPALVRGIPQAPVEDSRQRGECGSDAPADVCSPPHRRDMTHFTGEN